MANPLRIIIDTLGSDKGDNTIILGAHLLMNGFKDLNITLIGDGKNIKDQIESLKMDSTRIKIINATETISNNESTINAFFDKPNSSLLLSLKELSQDDYAIGVLSAGNTGALLMGTMKYLKVDNIRPCLAAILPNSDNKTYTCLVDVGATIDCTKEQLHNFAILGRDFMYDLYQIDSPRVGLLSNGSEAAKGNKLVKETYKLLEQDESINFIGNVEGNVAFSGICDVLVADGFVANQVLKVTEGTAMRIIEDVVKYSKDNPLGLEIAKYLKEHYDVSNLGGGIILGGRKPVIKCRGNSNEIAILNTGKMLINLYKGKQVYTKN